MHTAPSVHHGRHAKRPSFAAYIGVMALLGLGVTMVVVSGAFQAVHMREARLERELRAARQGAIRSVPSEPSSVQLVPRVGDAPDAVAATPSPSEVPTTPSIPIGTPVPPATTTPPATQQPPPAPPRLCYSAHAFYYPWYGDKETNGKWVHWNHPYLPHWEQSVTDLYPKAAHDPDHGDIGASYFPVLGPYSSWSNATIQRHLEWFVQAGIGVLVLSWYPPAKADENGEPSDALVPILLDLMAPYGVKLAFHSEPYSSRTETTLRADIEYIVKRYGGHSALYRAGPRSLPVIYVYDPYHVQVNDWARLFAANDGARSISVRHTWCDVVAIALMLKDNDDRYVTAGGFDGLYSYFASRAFTYGSDHSHWADISRKSAARGAFFVPSVGPGYDDLQVRPWNEVNLEDRQHGAYYNTSFSHANALNSDASGNGKEPVAGPFAGEGKTPPQWISITSFNEWHEGTQIEPAASQLKRARTPPGPDGIAGMNEYHRYESAGSGRAGEPDGYDSELYLDLTRHWLFDAPGAVCAGV
jgi:glycoprotein endo-alpha-1,2-mannosidase